MKLLIVVATNAELAPFFEHFHVSNENFIAHEKFDVLVTGVGMVATAFAIGQHLKTHYDLVLNVGIAGSFDRSIPLGSLVLVKEDILAELGAEDHDNFLTINELGFGENSFNASYEIPNLLKVKGITVNKVHGNESSIFAMVRQFSPQVESMEGAAVFYACKSAKIPCAQVRSISNYVEPREKENWKIGLAIKNLNDWLINFLEKNSAS